MRLHLALAFIVVAVTGCGDDSPSDGSGGGGAGSSGTASSSGGSSPSSSTTDGTSAGAGGDATGAGGDTTTGAGGGGATCTSEPLCAVVIDSGAKNCPEPFRSPLPAEYVEGARCVLEALRDRTDATVAIGFDDGFGYCEHIQALAIRGDTTVLRDQDYEDKGGTITTAGYELLAPQVYQDCLDLPDEELHTCFGFYALVGAPIDCPDDCTCGSEPAF